MKKIFIAFFSLIFIFSCNKDEAKPPFNNQKFYENHEAANWTKETVYSHLQGSWKLINVFCCGFGSNEWAAVEDGYFELHFEGDSVKVFTNNNLERTQYWEFDERYENGFYLETEDPISHTFGTMYFSEDYMLFNGSPSDLSDNYFQKVD